MKDIERIEKLEQDVKMLKNQVDWLKRNINTLRFGCDPRDRSPYDLNHVKKRRIK